MVWVEKGYLSYQTQGWCVGCETNTWPLYKYFGPLIGPCSKKHLEPPLHLSTQHSIFYCQSKAMRASLLLVSTPLLLNFLTALLCLNKHEYVSIARLIVTKVKQPDGQVFKANAI